MGRSVQVNTWGEETIVANLNFSTVQHNAVPVGVEVVAHGEVVAVVDMKWGFCQIEVELKG